MPLATITDYKVYASITGASEDTKLTALLSIAESYIRRLGGKDDTNGFESATRTEICDGDGATSIVLDERPVTSITSVKHIASNGALTAYTAEQYRVKASTGVLYGNGYGAVQTYPTAPIYRSEYVEQSAWPPGKANVEVVYVAGYVTIPKALQYAVFLAIDILRSDAGRGPYQSESIGGEYSYSRPPPADSPWHAIWKIVGHFA